MLALLLSLSLSAAPTPRLTYESKCLYCHSEEVTEHAKLTPAAWRALIERMRQKAPLLISRADVPLLTRYITLTLKLAVAPAPRPPKPAPSIIVTVPVPVVSEPIKEPDLSAALESPPPEQVLSDSEIALQQQASELMSRRCSKCHTLSRVYGKLDTFERSMATLERMRLKTGSGITDHDLKLLEEYLRSQF